MSTELRRRHVERENGDQSSKLKETIESKKIEESCDDKCVKESEIGEKEQSSQEVCSGLHHLGAPGTWEKNSEIDCVTPAFQSLSLTDITEETNSSNGRPIPCTHSDEDLQGVHELKNKSLEGTDFSVTEDKIELLNVETGSDNHGQRGDICDAKDVNSPSLNIDSSNNSISSHLHKGLSPVFLNGEISMTKNINLGLTHEELTEKRKSIKKALDGDKPDVKRLKELAVKTGGLLEDDLRRYAWPWLLNLEPGYKEDSPQAEDLKQHKDYHQVVLDVNRSLKRFPPGISKEQRAILQEQLTRLIIRVILRQPDLYYYQGYHDVAVTLLLVVGEEDAFNMLLHLSTHHLKEFMEPTMERTTQLLNYIYPLIGRENPELYNHMDRSGVGTLFCLPWFITWFGHVLGSYHQVVRLYDFFLATPPMMPLYLGAAVVLHREDEVLSTDCDMAMLHALLSAVPDDLPFEKLIEDAHKLFKMFPPESLQAEAEDLSRRSLLIQQKEESALRRRRRKGRSASVAVVETGPRKLVPLFLRHWVPYYLGPRSQRMLRMVVFTATLSVGLYAYFRTADALDLQIAGMGR